MKNIKELTEKEAMEILESVYPGKTNLSSPKSYEYWVTGISFEPVKAEGGGQYVTFGMRSIIGIKYHNGQDNCILHFDNTKVVLWLYKNGYDIQEFLESNSHFSQMENDFENFAYAVYCLGKGEEMFREDKKQNWTLDYVKKKCNELYTEYYLKDY